jgi:hypothetical protein
MRIKILLDDTSGILALQAYIQRHFPRASSQLTGVVSEAQEGVSIEITPALFTHTDNQRKYYRKYAGLFAKHCGMTPDEMHDELLCIAHGSEMIETKFGSRRRPLKRSGGSSRIDYSHLIDTLVRVAAEMGFDVPPPR